MNNKGLTLVETIAVLIILAIVAVIAVPNIAKNLRKGKNQLTKTQLNNITEAAKNWTMDNLDKIPEDDSAYKITVQELQDDGRIDNVIDPNSKTGSDIEAFSIIKQIALSNGNYKYEYGTYFDIDDYYKSRAIKYALDNNLDSANITTIELKNNGYLYNLVDKNGTLTEITEKQISVTKVKNEYKAEIN